VKFSRSQLPPITILFLLLGSCASYRHNVILRNPNELTTAQLTKDVVKTERNYVIQKNDLLKIKVYSNKGERLVDPNPEVSRPTANGAAQAQSLTETTYQVDLNGIIKFPVVGELKLDGLTLRQAESILQTQYEKFFTDSYVVLTFQNKRVIVLGAIGGHVIPLANQNMNLAEIIALSKGLTPDSKAGNIRLVRGEEVFIIDLTTIEGFQSGNMIMMPGDIVYVEPVRRPFAEGLRDYTGLIGIFLSTLSLIVVLRSIK